LEEEHQLAEFPLTEDGPGTGHDSIIGGKEKYTRRH